MEERTYNLDPANLLHEEGRDDVARQHCQTAQEADQVDEDVILLNSVQVAAMFLMLEGVVFHFTVDEILFLQIYRVIGRPWDMSYSVRKGVGSFVLCLLSLNSLQQR